MSRRGPATALTILLIGGCVGLEGTAAFPFAPSPVRPETLPSALQHVGWGCYRYRCRSRPQQSVVRIMSRPSARDFLSRVTADLNCCHAWSVPYYGYAYGPELSLSYDFPMAAPVGFVVRR
jgi:hypothetical protein